jgi:hypothetical protein
LISIHRKAAL